MDKVKLVNVDNVMVVAIVICEGERIGCLILPNREPYLAIAGALCTHVGQRVLRAYSLGVRSRPEDLALAALCFSNTVLVNMLYESDGRPADPLVRAGVHQSIRLNTAAVFMLCDMKEVTGKLKEEMYQWQWDFPEDFWPDPPPEPNDKTTVN